jgi:hypothetical protein
MNIEICVLYGDVVKYFDHFYEVLSSTTWEFSVDGINYYSSDAPFPIPQVSDNYCVSGVLPWNQTLYIRVTATCLDGSTVIDWTAVYNYQDDFPCDPNILNPQTKETEFPKHITESRLLKIS